LKIQEFLHLAEILNAALFKLVTEAKAKKCNNYDELKECVYRISAVLS